MIDIVKDILAVGEALMAFFNKLGVNFLGVIVVFVLMTVVKMADKKRKAKGSYFWLPFVFALVFSAVFTKYTTTTAYLLALGQGLLGIGSVSTVVYLIYERTVKDKAKAKKAAKAGT